MYKVQNCQDLKFKYALLCLEESAYQYTAF